MMYRNHELIKNFGECEEKAKVVVNNMDQLTFMCV